VEQDTNCSLKGLTFQAGLSDFHNPNSTLKIFKDQKRNFVICIEERKSSGEISSSKKITISKKNGGDVIYEAISDIVDQIHNLHREGKKDTTFLKEF
jgi:hypothetical protein